MKKKEEKQKTCQYGKNEETIYNRQRYMHAEFNKRKGTLKLL